MSFLSVISYSLCLVHLLLVPLAGNRVEKLPGFTAGSAPVQFLLFLPAFLLLSTSAALMPQDTAEKPFLVPKDRFRPKAPVPPKCWRALLSGREKFPCRPTETCTRPLKSDTLRHLTTRSRQLTTRITDDGPR